MITNSSQVNPEWLTLALRQSGRLPCGEVTGVHVAAEPTYTATIARLTLAYSHGAPPEAPRRLFLKLARLDSGQRAVGSARYRHEVDFHNRVGRLMPHPPIVHCYHAVYDEQTGASALLFDDVSETHFAGTSAAPPGQPYCESMIDAFAALHAYWWDNPALGSIDDFPSEESATDTITGIRESFPAFADFAADRLSALQRLLYDKVLAALPRLLQRVTGGHDLTLIHGDATLSNVMLPRDAGAGQALIIDWQFWGISFAAEDLSNLMALFWDGEQRRCLERPLLVRYHDRLLRHGVEHYAWADCWHDYRLAVIVRVLFMPMWFWRTGAPPASVWPNLSNALQAFDDLDCVELLDG
ncbi:MAG: aminoglycoside phosphotransferase family protein [Chloroflexi bacterium]|nr:aminoglycoside phosphotransferase family protein [Chloroflexota bacterium]MCL5275522.1 aminoglycoside phosphotransferase family protein [Chloroflexota bacterium]